MKNRSAMLFIGLSMIAVVLSFTICGDAAACCCCKEHNGVESVQNPLLTLGLFAKAAVSPLMTTALSQQQYQPPQQQAQQSRPPVVYAYPAVIRRPATPVRTFARAVGRAFLPRYQLVYSPAPVQYRFQ